MGKINAEMLINDIFTRMSKNASDDDIIVTMASANGAEMIVSSIYERLNRGDKLIFYVSHTAQTALYTQSGAETPKLVAIIHNAFSFGTGRKAKALITVLGGLTDRLDDDVIRLIRGDATVDLSQIMLRIEVTKIKLDMLHQ